MKRVFLSAGLALALTGVVYAQDNPAAGHPEGTAVVGKETDTIVQPKKTPVKVNRKVIEEAQQALATKGYDAGAADGVMGPLTRAALTKFQTDQNLNANGQLDQKTLAALNVGGVEEIKSAPSDLARGGKAVGHNAVGGHPVAAGKAAVEGGKNFGVKIGQGAESTAIKVKNKVGSGISAVGEKVTGAGEKTREAGETTEQAPDNNPNATPAPEGSTGNANPNPPRR